jgi:hypothetical protein
MTDPHKFVFGDSRCCHDLEDSMDSDSACCAILTCLQLQWSKDLQSIIQPAMQHVVTYMDVERLVKEKESRLGKHSQAAFIHLERFFNLEHGKDEEALWNDHHQHLEAQNPIPGLANPAERFCCNVCRKWFAKINKHRHRMRRQEPAHGDAIHANTLIQKRFTIAMYRSQHLLSFCVPLPEGWRPTEQTSSDSPPILAAISTPLNTENILTALPFAEAMGWSTYMHNLNIEKPSLLLALIQPPSKEYMRSFETGSAEWKMEAALLTIREISNVWVRDSDQRISGAHPKVQSAVTYEYVIPVFAF